MIRIFLTLALFLIIFLSPSAQGEEETVVLLHGLGNIITSTHQLEQRLREEKFLIHAPQYNSITQNIDAIKNDVFKKIDGIILNGRRKKIHFVGHSLGGLLIRSYLNRRNLENIGNVIFLGVPNNGSLIADAIKDKWWFRFTQFLIPPVVESLSTKKSDFLNELGAISPSYNFGVIAGNVSWNYYGIDIEGENDGYVSVDSTKINGMKHMVIVGATHIGLIYNKEVFDHVVYFLKNGRFIELLSK